MAEMIGAKGLDLSRASLKQYYSTQHKMYQFFATRAWDVCQLEDDFHGPTLDAYKWTTGNGAGASAASFVVTAGAANGAIVGTTGTAGDNTAAAVICSGRHFQGQLNAVITARLYIASVVTSVAVEVGFRDAITTTAGAQRVVATKATPTFTATDGAVWILDTNDNAYWEGVAVANAVGATTVEAAISPTASTYEYLQVASVGTVAYYSRFDANGRRTYGPVAQAAAVTATVNLAPFVAIEARNATSKTCVVDSIWVYQGRTTSP